VNLISAFQKHYQFYPHNLLKSKAVFIIGECGYCGYHVPSLNTRNIVIKAVWKIWSIKLKTKKWGQI